MMDQWQRVLQCLQHMQGANPTAIRAAEAQLTVESQQPGYGVILCQIALSAQMAANLRQLAAVLLKQYVKQHWVEGERKFRPPETIEQDKQQIRQALPAALMESDSKIRTAIGMAIAAIANWDWPQAWPGLMDFLVNSIKDRKDTNLLMGCLRCLSVMASDLDSEQAPQLLQALSPELAAVVSSAGTPAGVTATCFSIMAELAKALGSLGGAYQRQVRGIWSMLQPWVPLICGVLSSDVQDRQSWSSKHAALQLSLAMVFNGRKQLETSMPQLMGAVWQLLLAAQPLHQAVLIEGTAEDNDQADSDEDHVGLEALLAQLFELLVSFVGPAAFRQQLAAAVPQMIYVSIAYLQITQDQAETWAANASQFVADEEEDIVSCRASADMLMWQLADEFGVAALPALLEAVSGRCAEADAAATAGNSCWWCMREAAMMAVSACCDQVQAAVLQKEVPAEQVQQLLDMLLQRDLQPLLQQQVQLGGPGQQFVVGRALALGGKLCEVATHQQKELFLRAAAAAVTSNTSSTITVNGFRALAALARVVPQQQLQQQLQTLLPALVQLLAAAGEEAVHLVLEVLSAVIEATAPLQAGTAGGLNPEQAMAVAGPVLQVWIAHTSDPLIGPEAQGVIGAIASHPSCLPSVAATAAPTLAGILRHGAAAQQARRQGLPPPQAEPGHDGPMLVEASLRMLGTLVNPGQEAVASQVCHIVLGHVLSIILWSDDPSELSSAVILLVQLLRTCPTNELLSSTSDSPTSVGDSTSAVFAHILAAAGQLLSPNQPDTCSTEAGQLLMQLLKTFPAQLAAPAPAGLSATGASSMAVLLEGVAVKLARGNCSPATLFPLLQFVVNLALLDVQQLVETLTRMSIQQKDGSTTSGLAVVLPIWLENAPDFTGRLPVSQNAAAMLQLLQLRHNPAIACLIVQGIPIEDAATAGGGRVTRSKAKQQGGLRYSQVPVPVKILQVLGQVLSAEHEVDIRKFSGLELPDSGEGWEESGEDDSEETDDAEVQIRGQSIQGLSSLEIPDGNILDVMIRSEATTPVPEDPADGSDPLLRTSLRSLVRQGLAALVASDSGFVAAAAAQLGSGRELEALQRLLEPGEGAVGGS